MLNNTVFWFRTNPSDFIGAAEKLNMSLKSVRKSNQVMSKDLAVLVAKNILKTVSPTDKLFTYHRSVKTMSFYK